MKVLVLILIRAYWFLIPESKRRKCLFKVSCSNYVFQKTKREGLISGLRALMFRVNNCNSNYCIMELDQQQVLITKTGVIIKFEDHNLPNIKSSYRERFHKDIFNYK